MRQTTRDLRARLAKRPRRLDAVERGQPVVHHDDVGIELTAQLDDLRAVLDGGDDVDVGAEPEQQLERLAEDLVVLDEGDADGRGTGLTSVARRRGAMLVPRPRTQGAPVVITTGATEAGSGRAARPGGSAMLADPILG